MDVADAAAAAVADVIGADRPPHQTIPIGPASPQPALPPAPAGADQGELVTTPCTPTHANPMGDVEEQPHSPAILDDNDDPGIEPPTATAPAPEPEPAPEPRRITGELHLERDLERNWGEGARTPVGYPDDGEIGIAVKSLGRDQYLLVDQPVVRDVLGDDGYGARPWLLADVLGIIATDAVKGTTTPQQAVDQVRQLSQRMPAGSAAERRLAMLAEDLDAPPMAMPDLPSSTPEFLRTMVADLIAIPLVRRDRLELDAALAIVADEALRGLSRPRMRHRIREGIWNKRHECSEGKAAIDRIANAAIDAAERGW